MPSKLGRIPKTDQPRFWLPTFQRTMVATRTPQNREILCKSEKDGSSRIASLRVGSLEGFQQEIPVRNVILANGGMESTRFMVLHGLSSAQLLGKGFMEHPCADLGVCRTRMSLPLQRQFGTRMIKGKKYSVRLSLSEALEVVERIVKENMRLNICLLFTITNKFLNYK